MTTHSPLLDVQGVSFTMQGQTLLAPISLQLHPGELLLLTGPSGSGKSTLLKIMASLVAPTAGQIFFESRDIVTLKPERYRQQVSYCFQTPVLFGDTVYDNLALPWQIRQQKPQREQLVASLSSVHLTADMLDKKIEQLSGGEKQRVGLLRNLQFMPQVLLLDEVTSALDEENKAAINHLIDGLIRENNLAVMWISHDVQEISQAKKVLKLDMPQQGEAHEPA
ncbi:iron efflux ABC transporter ATP-binding subunit FetA [Candidatus Pantoea floridensis]|uniref:Putative ABC transport system ATP-binding protein n=1 Tax=Candidatus Pantoea floridensis TaxID=1938870 RepID=A0A286DLH8_9GAMM|nr:iron ABC transporter ATP-binding protein FetA [Pantoea floridensis]PIF14820.1 putative ABC transport system ATP-binding protein [Enterobacteriaceae bacterium JKS000233]SOD59480.1 putative ABC transport system ATP-binding protein [Pantoea floridensis]